MTEQEETTAPNENGGCPEGYHLVDGICVKKTPGPILHPPPPFTDEEN